MFHFSLKYERGSHSYSLVIAWLYPDFPQNDPEHFLHSGLNKTHGFRIPNSRAPLSVSLSLEICCPSFFFLLESFYVLCFTYPRNNPLSQVFSLICSIVTPQEIRIEISRRADVSRWPETVIADCQIRWLRDLPQTGSAMGKGEKRTASVAVCPSGSVSFCLLRWLITVYFLLERGVDRQRLNWEIETAWNSFYLVWNRKKRGNRWRQLTGDWRQKMNYSIGRFFQVSGGIHKARGGFEPISSEVPLLR